MVGSEQNSPLLRKGDLLIITSLDRLGRNYTEIHQQWSRITKEIGADIRVLDMPLLDTTSGDGSLDHRFIADLVLQILAYVSEKKSGNLLESANGKVSNLRNYAAENLGVRKLLFRKILMKPFLNGSLGVLQQSRHAAYRFETNNFLPTCQYL